MKKFSCAALVVIASMTLGTVGCGGHSGGVIVPEDTTVQQPANHGFESEQEMNDYAEAMKKAEEEMNEGQ